MHLGRAHCPPGSCSRLYTLLASVCRPPRLLDRTLLCEAVQTRHAHPDPRVHRSHRLLGFLVLRYTRCARLHRALLLLPSSCRSLALGKHHRRARGRMRFPSHCCLLHRLAPQWVLETRLARQTHCLPCAGDAACISDLHPPASEHSQREGGSRRPQAASEPPACLAASLRQTHPLLLELPTQCASVCASRETPPSGTHPHKATSAPYQSPCVGYDVNRDAAQSSAVPLTPSLTRRMQPEIKRERERTCTRTRSLSLSLVLSTNLDRGRMAVQLAATSTSTRRCHWR